MPREHDPRRPQPWKDPEFRRRFAEWERTQAEQARAAAIEEDERAWAYWVEFGRGDYPGVRLGPIGDHGTWRGWGTAGCRCPTCVEWYEQATAYAEEQAALRLRKPGIGDKHGTKGGYALGCRCNDCVEAVEDVEHGTVSRYKTYGCRCPRCRWSMMIYQAQQEVRRG